MYIKFLFPNRFKILGWIMAIPSFFLMIFVLPYEFSFSSLDYTANGGNRLALDNGFIFNLQSNNFTDEIGSILLITGLTTLILFLARFNLVLQSEKRKLNQEAI